MATSCEAPNLEEELRIEREPVAFELVARDLFAERGELDVGFDPLGVVPRLGTGIIGATLRLTTDGDTVEDFTLVARRGATSERFVRWFFGFREETALTEAAVLDALGEFVNQAAGRFKERILHEGQREPEMGVPRLLQAEACERQLVIQRNDACCWVRSPSWPGALLLIGSSARQVCCRQLDAALRLLTEAGEDRVAWVNVRSIVTEVTEQVGTIAVPEPILESLGRCDLAAARIVSDRATGSSRDVALLGSEIGGCRGLLDDWFARAERASFRLPDDSDEVELLGDFVDEAETLLDDSRTALEQPTPDGVHRLFRNVHTIKGNAGFFGLGQIQRVSHAAETMLEAVRTRDGILEEDVAAAVRRTLDGVRMFVDAVRECLDTGDMEVPHQAELADLTRRLEFHNKHGGRPTLPPSAGRDSDGQAAGGGTSVRVSQEQVAQLESIEQTLAAMLAEIGPDFAQRRALGDAAEQLRGICRSLRKVSLQRLFSKVARLCRETADQLGKLVEVDLDGEDVEVPRHVVAALSGPMVHLARNAVDHGIETDEERQSTAKPRVATVHCRARWSGAWLVVEVQDDGRGIDPSRIRDKACRLGLADDDAELSQKEILAFIMSPGFSTAAQTTDISGRGVGLDVVKQEIESVGGRIELESDPGRGSMFRIMVPETMGQPEPAEDASAARGAVAREDATSDEGASEDDDLEAGDAGELMFL